MIDQALQSSLRERYNPDGSPLRTQQMLMLDLLLYVDAVCRRNNIPYWLSSGTLLGAVRHGGFIPWDDDLDIEMTLPDYRRLLSVLPNEPNPKGYVLHTTATDPDFLFPFAKLRHPGHSVAEADGLDARHRFHGVYIDIFPLAPFGSRRLHRLGSKLLGTELKMRVGGRGKRTLAAILKPLLHGAVFPLMRLIGPIGANGRLRHVVPSYFPAERYSSEIFPLSTITFEGHPFPAPANTDAYLRRIYGDYMALPSTITQHLSWSN